MHIALVNLTGGGLSGGGKKTMAQLVPELLRVADVKQLNIFVHPRQLEIAELCSVAHEAWPTNDALRGYPWLRNRLRVLRPDVVYIPNARWLNFGAIPTVTMVRNMEAASRPLKDNPPGAALKNVVRAFLAKRACNRATRVIAVSDFVRRFLVESWGISREKVGLVYHGVEMPTVHEPANIDQTNGNESGAVWFTAGSILNYRGIEDALQALQIRKRHGQTDRLVVAGALVRGYETYDRHLREMANRLGIAGQVEWLGHTSSQELSRWMFNCHAFIMTSRVEACPNVVLEALAHGCASISTDCPPMPEFYRDAALYYPVGDAQALALHMALVDRMNAEARQRLQHAARLRSRDFSWKRAAIATTEQCRLAVEAHQKLIRDDAGN